MVGSFTKASDNKKQLLAMLRDKLNEKKMKNRLLKNQKTLSQSAGSSRKKKQTSKAVKTKLNRRN